MSKIVEKLKAKRPEIDIRADVNEKLEGLSKPKKSQLRTKVRGSHQSFRSAVMPRSILGMAALLVAFAVGIAFSGAAFYAYYNSRLTENEQAVGRFVDGFDQQFNDASGTLEELRVNSVEQIRQELAPLESYVDRANGVVSLPAEIGESVWVLETRNSQGQISFGSAFAVVGHEGGTAFVTSLSLVSSATRSPGPDIELVKGDRRLSASIWAWDAATDLALVVVSESVTPLNLASESAQLEAVGQSGFAMSGVGGQGSTAVPGVVVDKSTVGIQHTMPIGSMYVGGPVVNASGEILGMVSDSYEPYGVSAGQVGQAPDVVQLCSTILKCSGTQQIEGLVNSDTKAPASSDSVDSEEAVEE